MRKIVFILSLVTLFLFGCSTSETDELDLIDDAVTLSESESNSLTAKGPPEKSGPVIRGLLDIGFYILDKDTNLTALFGWDAVNIWPPEYMELHMYQWSEVSGNGMGHGELRTLVYQGTPDWPIFGDCIDCEEFFDNPTLVASGTSKFTYLSNLNTSGNTFNGQLVTPDGDTVILSAKFKINGGNLKYVESVKLNYK